MAVSTALVLTMLGRVDNVRCNDLRSDTLSDCYYVCLSVPRDQSSWTNSTCRALPDCRTTLSESA